MKFIEMLESRQLLSSVAVYESAEGQLSVAVVTGAKPDVIVVEKKTEPNADNPADPGTMVLTIAVNGQSETFVYEEFEYEERLNSLFVNSGAGNDIVTITSDSVGYRTWIEVDAGVGNDTVSMNSGFAIVSGGAGNDFIVGKANAAPLAEGNLGFSFVGNAGNDVLIGSEFDDAFNGNEGNDLILAGAGDDYIQFGEGNDLVLAGAGDDYMVKGYNDMSHATVFGGCGNDTLAVFAPFGSPLDTTFSQLRIVSVEDFIHDRRG